MQEIWDFIKAIFTRVHHAEPIVSRFIRDIEKLHKVADLNENEVDRNHTKATKIFKKNEELRAESDKARKVANKLNDLVTE